MFWSSIRSAATPASQTQVRTSLVAADAAVQPGRPLTVALRLQHKEHWHTYWINPGTGLPTSLAWKLPPGWRAGEILWPAPMVLRDSRGNIVGNGYEGDLLLPVTLTPPADLAPGGRVELKAAADWLMCEEVCIPGGAEVSLSLPVAAAAPAPNAEWGERIRGVLARLPRADADWTVAGSRNGGLVNVEIRPAARSGAAHSPEDLHLFSVDGLVAYDLPQRVEHRPDGSISITVKVDPAAPADAKRLVGVVTARNGWRADGSLPGLAIEIGRAHV